MALGICQALLCAAIAWTAYVTTQSIPFWPINPSLAITPWFTMQLDLVLCLWAVLPAAILWGASFPLALASVASPGQDPARLVGGVYAANTVGAIVGSLAASFVLVAWIGSQHAQQVLIVTSLVSALLVLAWGVVDHGADGATPRSGRRQAGSSPGRPRRCCWRAASLKCRACSSPTDATRRRAPARTRSSTRTRG